MKVSVIIVNYNTSDYLESCIDSVNKYEEKTETEFIIVDNKSSDNSKSIIAALTKKHKNVRSIFLDSNYGFAYANNRGYEIATGEYILVLNPDVQLTESVFENLIKLSSDLSIGAFGVKLFGLNGEFQKGYYQKSPSIIQYILFYSILSKPFLNNNTLKNRFLISHIDPQSKALQDTKQIPGAFMFIKSNVYKLLNGFNESFFLFFEDVDLSYRISKSYKLKIADIKVKHVGASSMMTANNNVYGYYVLSMLNFYRNNYKFFSYLIMKIIIVYNTLFKIMIEYIKKLFHTDKPGIMEVQKYILIKLFSKNG